MSTPPRSRYGTERPPWPRSRSTMTGSTAKEIRTGFEVSFINLLHFRYGVADSDFTMYGIGFGWDYGPVLFRLDYAHQEPEDEFLELLDYNRDTFGGLIGVRW
jgi:hypothetical protein